ncbi:WD40/YVTN/BNR-like repeat-containing protein [Coleofasciculus sp. E1-EBD-02]|uniref:WD40/YVTN/BNR-like repeat-containing protein n=1 Tax=Coleofasciculus sp. E1-EBD-02 TaxID=3068481 RepID=UPI0032F7428D
MEVSEKKNINKVLAIVKSICYLLLLSFIFCFGNVQAALAHTPHDDIYQVELSPTYDQDEALYIIVRGIYLKSTDGGQSWKRIVRGLDNINNLAALSTYAQTNKTLFLSSFGDGIYKSDDAGESWIKTNKGLDSLDIDLISISPHDADVVLATGSQKGLYKTNNGGEDWQKVIENDKITAIAFLPENKNKVIIGNNQGKLNLSSDGGESWQQLANFRQSGAVTAIAFSPNFSSDLTFFVGTEKAGIYKTVDQGQSFLNVNQGLSDPLIKDIAVVSDSQNNLTLLASAGNQGIFRSKNGGKTWEKYSQSLTKDVQADSPSFEDRDHFSYLRISPNFTEDKTVFLAGFNGLFKSTDGGRVWQELETLSPRTIIALDVSPDYQNDSTIAIAAYNKEAYISNDQGNSWRPINKGLTIPRYKKDLANPIFIEVPRFYEIMFSPNYRNDKTLFAVLAYKVLKSTDGGNNWDLIPIKTVSGYSTRGMTMAISADFVKDKTVYLATKYGGLIYKSTNGGKNFSVAGKIDHALNALVISPNFSSDQTLYASSPDGIYQTVDGGATWELTTDSPELGDKTWSQLAISPNYQADQTVIAGSDKGLFKTKDAGTTWEKIVGSAYGGNGYVEAIAFSPNFKNDQTFLVTIRGKGVFKTVNGGETFSQIDALIEQNHSLSPLLTISTSSVPIKFSPSYATDNTIYGFGTAGADVLKSTDGGQTWQIISVPRSESQIDNFVTSLKVVNLVFHIYPFLGFIAALVLALPSYLLLGYLGLEKKLPLHKWQIKSGGAFVVFLAVLLVLYT